MAEELNKIYSDLYKIRQYLVKVGPKRRRESNVCGKKLVEASSLYLSFEKLWISIECSIKYHKSEELSIIQDYRLKINELYTNIKELCDSVSSSSSSDFVSVSEEERKSLPIMGKFDLKVALNLVPVMINNEEHTVRQVIDSIDYYSTILELESQKELIVFVLKSRLSQAAKLKLSTSYDSVDSLLKDMKIQLLPKKSHTALQSKLHSFRQNDLTIDDYGKTITEIFVDLTVSQSDGKPENYNFLRQLNEKQAIKRFADGLRNRRLGTIITARNFDSLKDAIQAAVEEDTTTASSSPGEIRTFHKNNYHYRRGINNYFRGQSGRYFRGQSSRGQLRGEHYAINQGASRGHTSRGSWQNGPRNRPYRGKSSFYSRNKGTQNNETVRVMTENEKKTDGSGIPNQFFRE